MGVENVQHKPDLNNHKADVVVVGGGPAGMHLTHELHKKFGSGFHTLVLEQADVLGGSGSASMQQLRTFQSDKTMVEMIAKTREWYDQVGRETETKLLTPLPYLFITTDEDQLSQYRTTLKRVQEWGHGKGGEIWTPENVRLNFPFVDRDITGALYYPEAFQLDFSTAINYITKEVPNATFALGTAMADIKIKNGKVIGVETPQGFVATEKVVLATGPFAIKTGDRIIEGQLNEAAKLTKLIEVRKRQRYSAAIKGLPPHTKVFIISPEGQYVRLHTDEDGTGSGDYGYAASDDPLVADPIINPKANEMEFPAVVYDGLSKVMSAYGNEEKTGPLATRPLPGSRIAGYYAETPDDLPVVCETSISGLFLDVAHSHAGVMSMGAAEHMANIIEKGESVDNPFGIDRKFQHDGIRL